MTGFRAGARGAREKEAAGRLGIIRRGGGAERGKCSFSEKLPLVRKGYALTVISLFLRAMPAPINKTPAPLAGFLFFCMPVRYRYGGGKGLSFGRSRADLPPHGGSRGKARRVPPRPAEIPRPGCRARRFRCSPKCLRRGSARPRD